MIKSRYRDFLVFISFFIFGNLFSQDTIFNDKYFLNEIDNYKKYKIQYLDTILKLNQNKSKLNLLNLLPNLNTNIYPSRTISVQFQLNSFILFIQQNKRNQIELSKFKLEYINSLNNQINQFYTEVEELKKQYLKIHFDFEILNNYNELVQIKEKQFNQNQINVENIFTYRENQLKLNKSLLLDKEIYNIKKNNLIRKLKNKSL